MKQHEEVTFQTLADNEDIQIGYSDSDIMVVDSIQQFTEVNTAHVSMNTIVICTDGKVQAQMNGMQMELRKNQVAVIPQNVTVTDVMVSPDFNLKAMFLTNRILQSFLREKMNIWNDMMYIHRHHVVTMDEDEILFYAHFYDMLTLAIAKGKDNPLHTDVIQSLLRGGVLGLCGALKQRMLNDDISIDTHISPTLPSATGRPSSSNNFMFQPAAGIPILPGFGSIHWFVNNWTHVSVWPKPSCNLIPVISKNLSYTSGFNASPTTSALVNLERSYLDVSACISIL